MALGFLFSNPFPSLDQACAGEGGTCHFHGNSPATQEVVIDCAAKRKTKLVSSGKIDSFWAGLTHEKIELVDGKKGKEWRITYKDPNAKDKTKETLFLFFSLSGNFIAANFTGK